MKLFCCGFGDKRSKVLAALVTDHYSAGRRLEGIRNALRVPYIAQGFYGLV
jgi:hypothetical protein